MFNIEVVPCKLTPFDWAPLSSETTDESPLSGSAFPLQNTSFTGYQPASVADTLLSLAENSLVNSVIAAAGFFPEQFPGLGMVQAIFGPGDFSQSSPSIYDTSHPLYPLTQTNGLVFPYNPVISESIAVKYDVTELTHTNENIHAFKNTDNIRINLSECVWTAETFDQAIYTLAVIHFFRSYRLMDFGRGANSPSGGRTATPGRPPSPMWFSAYGKYMYSNLPVVMENVQFSFPNDVDYVGVPDPGTSAYDNQQLQFASSFDAIQSEFGFSQGFTWIPIKFTVGSIGLIVQHSIAYWTTQFNLDDYRSGLMITRELA